MQTIYTYIIDIGLGFNIVFLKNIIFLVLLQCFIWGFVIISFCLVFYFFLSGYLGLGVKEKFSVMLNRRNFIINIFIISYILTLFLGLNTIHLDSTVININIDNELFKFTGEGLKYIANFPAFVNIGNGVAFTVCANIARSLVIKHNMGLLPKMGFVIASGAGGGIIMNIIRVVNNYGLPETNVNLILVNQVPNVVQASLTSDTSSMTNLNNIIMFSQWVNNHLGITTQRVYNLTKHTNEIVTTILSGNNNLSSSTLVNSQILNSVNLDIFTSDNWNHQPDFIRQYLPWAQNYINNRTIYSVNDSIVSDNIANAKNNLIFEHIIQIITNNVYLHYINIYLLAMLFIIITCRYLIGDNQLLLEKLKKLPFGDFIYKIISWYTNIWVKSSIIWIYYIITVVILFNCVSIYSFSHIISIIK